MLDSVVAPEADEDADTAFATSSSVCCKLSSELQVSEPHRVSNHCQQLCLKQVGCEPSTSGLAQQSGVH